MQFQLASASASELTESNVQSLPSSWDRAPPSGGAGSIPDGGVRDTYHLKLGNLLPYNLVKEVIRRENYPLARLYEAYHRGFTWI